MSRTTNPQRALAGRLRAVLAADPRVEAVWLSGSFGRGEGDPWSDIDLMVVVAADDRPALVADYGGPQNPVGETVLLFTLYGRIVCAVRPDWERYDMHFVTARELEGYDRASLRPLALESLDEPAPPGRVRAPTPPHADAVLAEAHEFLRILGLLPGAIGREEWLSAQEGVGLMRRALVELMIASNGFGRLDRGAKRLNPYLTADQRAALEALPLPAPGREALIAANRALAALFLPLAKAAMARSGGAWPQPLEDATRAHLERTLGPGVWP